jgi:sugar/nucleoside kinase (ribokinase family)
MAEHGVVEALRWGNAVAALKVQREKPRDLPTRAEVAALLA